MVATEPTNRAGRPGLPRVAVPQVRTVSVETMSTGRDLPMEPEWDAYTAFRWGYYANTFVYACVRANAEDVASLPIRAGVSLDDPSDWNPRAPLAVLLGPPPGTPNPTATAEQLMAWSITQLRVCGRFAWELEFNSRGRIVGLWPLISSRLKPIPSNGGSSYWAGFEYDTGAGPPRRLSAEQVLYHWRPAAHDWRQPESALQAARLDISVAVMQDRYDYAFLKNDARPAAVVVHEAFNDVKDRDAWRGQFLDGHQGPDNAGKVVFTQASPNGATAKEALAIHTLGLSQRDGEFINRYAAKVRAITVALGTPLSRIGDASGRTFSNADREESNYWKHTVHTLAKEVQAAINLQLAPRIGSGEVCWFDVSGIDALQPPPRFSGADVPNLVAAGLMTVNEARSYIRLKPVPGGDVLGAAPAPAEVPELDPAGEGPDSGGVEDTEAVGELAGGARPEARSVVVQERALAVSQAHVDVLERRWRTAMNKLLARQMREALRRLEGKRGRQTLRADGLPNADGLFDPNFWQTETEEVAGELYEAVVAMAGANAVARIGISFDLEAPWVQAFITSRANKLAGQVTTTTYQAIQNALAAGVAEGDSIPALAERIRRLFLQTYANRAETVARTEVLSAYNGASWEVGQAVGTEVVAGYEWLATLDSRTRADHLGAHGQVIGPLDLFDVGGHLMRYPGDPAGGAHQIVNCRCTVLALTPEEMADRAAVARSSIDAELQAALDLVQL